MCSSSYFATTPKLWIWTVCFCVTPFSWLIWSFFLPNWSLIKSICFLRSSILSLSPCDTRTSLLRSFGVCRVHCIVCRCELLHHTSGYPIYLSQYKETQYQNPVMNVKLKITRFCNWLQSLRLYFWLEVFR